MVGGASPFLPAAPIGPAELARLRQRAIFECCKWDPQVEDVSTLSPLPLLLPRTTWEELAALAERLAAEAERAEREILARPALAGALGLPRAIRRALTRTDLAPSRGAARVVRFDFHRTAEGWRISEANSDVPGGFNEASGYSRLVAREVAGTPEVSTPEVTPAGDPAGQLADAIAAAVRPGGRVALVHATAYTDDRQVMVFLARQLAERRLRPLLLGPDHVLWQGGRAFASGAGEAGPIDFVYRFFPGEWLPGLGRRSGWPCYLRGGVTPIANPAFALATQSKRFPLIWDHLSSSLPTWRTLLPETVDPRDADWRGSDRWVVKPALGRVGDGIGMAGVTPETEQRTIARAVRFFPRRWVAQRRFTAVPLATAEGAVYPCLGIYTVDGRAAGAYGRLARLPLINHLAQDAAVLVVDANARGAAA
jgi:glutathionylspermidine synthase